MSKLCLGRAGPLVRGPSKPPVLLLLGPAEETERHYSLIEHQPGCFVSLVYVML